MYWKHKFGQLCAKDKLSEFVVIGITDEEDHINLSMSRAAARQKFHMVEVEVMRKYDLGRNDNTFLVKTHLGNHLKHNDTVLGYDIKALTAVGLDDVETLYKGQAPDIVIVKKHYPKFRKRQQKRYWKLKHMNKEDEDEDMVETAEEGARKTKKQRRDKKN